MGKYSVINPNKGFPILDLSGEILLLQKPLAGLIVEKTGSGCCPNSKEIGFGFRVGPIGSGCRGGFLLSSFLEVVVLFALLLGWCGDGGGGEREV
ncbi:hypothetical protein Pyn_38454 [Prunus yedoensis var. nudiflora]|uniref:Uncharacterized protein n=1 Tax=Prunus yedoensis var. nudiflora TaxID=2094558 RepID=A0A314UB54_PRUYE|nr:hypothetical protein Pyn_38454 [Prunus yedoensis var. nudiflora]